MSRPVFIVLGNGDESALINVSIINEVWGDGGGGCVINLRGGNRIELPETPFEDIAEAIKQST